MTKVNQLQEFQPFQCDYAAHSMLTNINHFPIAVTIMAFMSKIYMYYSGSHSVCSCIITPPS